MAKRPSEFICSTSLGQSDYAPTIAATSESGMDIPLLVTRNITQRRRSLMVPHGATSILQEGETLTGAKSFASYVQDSDRSLWLYILADSPKRVIFSGNGIRTIEMSGSGVYGNQQPFGKAQYTDAVYVTSHLTQPQRLVGSARTPLDFDNFGSIRARYAIIADDHLMFGNVIQNGVQRPYRLIWSDLYNPTKYEVSTSSEAGSFDVDYSNFQITGLSYQRGQLIVYTQTAIWRGQYIGLDAGIYQFTPLYNGIGNQYHFAVATVKEVDIFIGRDSFYMLDGSQLERIGDPIWEFFRQTRKLITTSDFLVSRVDEINNEVYWTYEANGQLGTIDGENWQIVYNYRDGQWSSRSALTVVDEFSNEYSLEAGVTWDEVDGDWEDFTTETWEDFSEPINISALRLSANNVYGVDESYAGLDSAAKSCMFETHDLIFGSFFSEKEIFTMRAIYEGLNINSEEAFNENHNLKVEFGVRDRLSQPIRWQTARSVSDIDEDEFHLTNMTPGKYIRFRFTWTNTASYYISRFVAFSLLLQTPYGPQENR